MLRKLLVWSLPLVLTTAVAFAKSTDGSKELQEMQKQATLLDNEASNSQGHEAIFESLSKQLNIPVETLKAQQQSTKFGFGQLFIANALATASGKTFDQISQEFKSGTGWGVIAKENNVKVGKLVSDLKRANRDMKRERTETQANANRTSGSQGSAHQNQQATPRGNSGHGGGSMGKR